MLVRAGIIKWMIRGRVLRLIAVAGLTVGVSFAVAHTAQAQGVTDAAHLPCAQGGGNGPVFGSGDGGGITALTHPGADHGAAGVLANATNAGGSGENDGGNAGGLGGSSLIGGGAAGCGSPFIRQRVLPATGGGTGRMALTGLALALGGMWLLNLSRLHAYALSLGISGTYWPSTTHVRAARRAVQRYLRLS